MCIHRREDEEGVLKRFRRLSPGAAWAIIRMLHPDGSYGQGYPVHANDAQDVANRVRDIQAWHDGDGATVVDLSHVNEVRASLGLADLSVETMPGPVGEVPPSEDLGEGEEAATA